MGLGSSCRSLGAAEEEEEEGCVVGGIASASRGLLPGETSRTGGPALGSNLKVLALQGEDVDGHGGPRLNRVLRHLKGNVLVAVIAHVNPERVLLVLASEEEEEGDRSTSASSPSGGLRRPFLPRFPPPQSPVPITDAVAVAVGKPALTSVAISLALLCLSPSGAGDAMALPHSPCFLRRAVPPRWPRVCPLRAQKRTACLPERIYYASRNALRRRVEIRFPCGASQRCVLYTPHSVQESTPGFARSRLDSCASPGPSKNLPNF